MRFFVLLSALLTMSVPAVAETFDSIAAVVNNEAVSCYELEQDVQKMQQQLRMSGAQQLPSAGELRKQALEKNVDKLLQLQQARQLELSVGDEEVDQAVKNVELSNKLMPGQLEEALQQQGMTLKSYKKALKDQMLIGKLINVAVRGKIQPSEESMREYYRKYMADGKPRREVQLAQLLMPLPDDPTPAQVSKVRDQIRAIRRQLDEGVSFEQLVALHSQAPGRDSGGVIGWFSAGAISERFTQALELPVGAVSEPIRAPSGFYLIKVVQERWQEPEKTGESYDEVHARHILLQIPTNADDATRSKIYQRAESIAADMKGASDEGFATRAKEESQGPSAGKGGDLGWFRRGTMVAAFEDAAFSLKPGETSGVVETGFGLHIIRVVASRHIDPNSFEAHRDEIHQILSNVEMQEQLPRWMEGLKARADIEVYSCDIAPISGSN